jgi:hypothetical protein
VELCLHLVAEVSRAEHWIKETQRWQWQQERTWSIQHLDSFVWICKPALKVSVCRLLSVIVLFRQQWTFTVRQTWRCKVDRCLQGCVQIAHVYHSPHFPVCVAYHFSASQCFGVIYLILHRWLYWGFSGYLQYLLRLTCRDSVCREEHIERWQSDERNLGINVWTSYTHRHTIWVKFDWV